MFQARIHGRGGQGVVSASQITAEIARILDMGVEVRLNTRLDDPMASCEQEGFDAELRGEVYEPRDRSEIAAYEHLETWYDSDAPRSHRPRLETVRRVTGFAEVVGSLDAETAAYEARRCMPGGYCFECDNCYGFRPDNAITKDGPGRGFSFKYDYWKGCGLCESECPCGAIRMVPEA